MKRIRHFFKKRTISRQAREGNGSFKAILSGMLIGIIVFGSRNIPSAWEVPISAFHTIFISIVIQAFPFMLIGVLVSSFMHVFIPNEWVLSIFPKRFGLGFVTALFAGFFFPVCECAIVPVMNRLMKKGVPMPVAVTFMLSAPIINPIVLLSTWYAFPGQPEVVIYRVCFGLLIALLVGIGISIYAKELPVLREQEEGERDCFCSCGGGHHSHTHGCGCHEEQEGKDQKGLWNKEHWRAMLLHGAEEFFDVGKYLIIGAFIASGIQQLLPLHILTTIRGSEQLSLFMMMAVAFLFSACSTSDAFIARGYAGTIPLGGIMGFLVFGPMMDIKNLCMLFSHFKKEFVIRLTLFIIVVNIMALTMLNAIFL